jgi:hypothetical protein
MQPYRFRVNPFMHVTYTIEGDALVFRGGARLIHMPLSRVQAFGVRERPAFYGMPASQLIVRLSPDAAGRSDRSRAIIFDPTTDAGRELLGALRARLPAADTTGLPWLDAAARLAVPAHPWYEGFLHPRSFLGTFLLGAVLTAAVQEISKPDRSPYVHEPMSQRVGFWSPFVVVAVIGLALVLSGFRRTRALRSRSKRAQ